MEAVRWAIQIISKCLFWILGGGNSRVRREFLEEWSEQSGGAGKEEVVAADELKNMSLESESPSSSVQCPEILTGECIEDRKSVFQVRLVSLNLLMFFTPTILLFPGPLRQGD